MRLAIMQPYFFPYLGHFSLIAACDEWIVFDLSQYTPRSWLNRNRIRHQAGGSKWLTVPLAAASIHMRIHEASLLDVAKARQHVLDSVAPFRRAPYFAATIGIVEAVFATADRSLTRLNARALAAVCRYVGLDFRYRIASELDLRLPAIPGPGDWAPAICAALGATGYINPISGQALFNPAQFAALGIDLQFLQPTPFAYSAGREPIETDLSILDVLMWNGPAAIRAAIDRYTVVGDTGFEHPPELRREDVGYHQRYDYRYLSGDLA